MKVLVEYETGGYWNNDIKRPVIISETRSIDDDCYPRIIGRVMREIHDKGHDMLNIRCLDPHPKEI